MKQADCVFLSVDPAGPDFSDVWYVSLSQALLSPVTCWPLPLANLPQPGLPRTPVSGLLQRNDCRLDWYFFADIAKYSMCN